MQPLQGSGMESSGNPVGHRDPGSHLDPTGGGTDSSGGPTPTPHLQGNTSL